uniref:ATP synthase F(0) complex subunit a n=1 Tax=Anolis carolinensis TaxID=28377 RepID=A0A803SQ71_ANOCA
MILSFFDQFSIPTILGVPLIFIATIFPTLLIVIKNNRLVLFIRPLALGVRLTANITAGHLLIQLISTATFVLLPIITITATITFIVLLLLTGLEIAVALIQAYVFVLLLSLYLQENV